MSILHVFLLYKKWSSRNKVPPRFELGSLDSKSRVLTITPWNPKLSWSSIIVSQNMIAVLQNIKHLFPAGFEPATLCVWSTRDNRYTKETWQEQTSWKVGHMNKKIQPSHLGIEPRTFGLEVQRAILCANGTKAARRQQRRAPDWQIQSEWTKLKKSTSRA